MKNNKKNNLSKGSVLIAVIGILAVLSIMALRFNAEMETAMIKTVGKNQSSDVKVLADSGLKYATSLLLMNGVSCKGDGTVADYIEPVTLAAKKYPHIALRIEEDMEMINKGVDSIAVEYGIGIGQAPKYFSSNYFMAGNKSTLGTSYIPEALSLAPGNVNFCIEDLSGKLPIGHVQQYYQRLLISAALTKLLTNNVPVNFNAELFEDTNSTEVGGYDDYQGSPIYLRSLIPYSIAKSAGSNQKDSAGFPIKDGIISVEELGSSYTWINGGNLPSQKKHATDIIRSTTHYILLANALTPFSRFSFYEPEVSYAQINPMVMFNQNERLYKAFFNYEPTDKRLKMCYSVSFQPDPAHGSLVKDDESASKSALADPLYFENNVSNMMLSGMPSLISATATSAVKIHFAYNARDDASDKRPASSVDDGVGFLRPDFAAITYDDKKSWDDGEFGVAPDKKDAYYVAMNKAVERMARAFKGTKRHLKPADNVMLPILTRKSLELAIIKSVFGDSILFVVSDIPPNQTKKVFFNDYGANSGKPTTANEPEDVNYLRMHRALEAGEIKLENVKFAENAFAKIPDDPGMAADYFVPFWQKDGTNQYNTGVKSATKFQTAGDPEIKFPAFGLFYDGVIKEYVNYLAHPNTDQRQLANSFVTIAAAYSHKHMGDAKDPGATTLPINKLYENTTVSIASCKIAAGDTNDAFRNLTTNVVDNSALPANEYIQLYRVPVDADGKITEVNLKPADFTPYETKIRMAVLVNLLNAVISEKISLTQNATNSNATLFNTSSTGLPKNLKEYIYFDNGQYKVNGNANFLNGWDGGVKTPGMTFWKYNTNSTTFQITVDAFKYEDAIRLSSVITFDLKDGQNKKLDKATSYDLKENEPELYSAIYLNPLGRMKPAADKFVIGNGRMRYPTVTDTDSWRMLSFVWSTPFGRGVSGDDYFNPIFLYPETVVNIGADLGSWHFEPHPLESGTPAFTRFFYGSNNYYAAHLRVNSICITGMPDNWWDINPLAGGPGQARTRSYGAGSWLKWKCEFTKAMSKNTLELNFRRFGANANSGYTQNHKIEIYKRNTNSLVWSKTFGTKSDWGYQENYPFLINVDMPKGDYDVKLTETNHSNTGSYGDERFVSISIYPKE